MEALVHKKKGLLVILLKQKQSFAWVYIVIMIIVICLLIENKSLSLKSTIKVLTFPSVLFWKYF